MTWNANLYYRDDQEDQVCALSSKRNDIVRMVLEANFAGDTPDLVDPGELESLSSYLDRQKAASPQEIRLLEQANVDNNRTALTSTNGTVGPTGAVAREVSPTYVLMPAARKTRRRALALLLGGQRDNASSESKTCIAPALVDKPMNYGAKAQQ